MKTSLLPALLLIMLFGWACGDSNSGNSETNNNGTNNELIPEEPELYNECSDDSPCPESLECAQGCTEGQLCRYNEGCTERGRGSAVGCPENSYCRVIDGAPTRCQPICETDADCGHPDLNCIQDDFATIGGFKFCSFNEPDASLVCIP